MSTLLWLTLNVPAGRPVTIEITRGLVGKFLVVLGLIALIILAFIVYSRRRRASQARCPICGRTLPRGGLCPYCAPLTGEYTGIGLLAPPGARPVSPLPPTIPEVYPTPSPPRIEVAPTMPEVGPTLVPEAAELTRLVRRGPQWTLLVKAGPQVGASFTLSGDAVLGRQKDCTVRLMDNSVSRRHAQLRVQDDSLIIKDLKSANGTLINGRLISEPTPLQDGDELTLGETILTVQMTND
jgi:hypothetical protein